MNSNCSNSLHVFDLDSLTLQRIQALNGPDKRDGHSMVHYNGSLVIFAGCKGRDSSITYYNDVWRFYINQSS